MKEQKMKCPKCNDVSTFNCWHERMTVLASPLMVEGGEIIVDFNNATEEDKFDLEPKTCICNKCCHVVDLSLIHI